MSANEQNDAAAEPTPADPAAVDRLPAIYAFIWKAHQPDDQFDAEEFSSRIPRLMVWLRGLYAGGNLVACGGGGFENHAGGLTLVRAESPEQAMELMKGSPMVEIGTHELMVWDVYYGDLQYLRTAPILAGDA